MSSRANKRAKNRAKRADPLGPRTSRVQKTRAPTTGLPSWYCRVLGLISHQSPFDPRDPEIFDEDLSELEDNAKRPGKKGGDREFPDSVSEISYDGSDADLYYRLKEEREERKWEKRREKLQQKKDKDRQLELEKSKEDEVNTACESLQGQTSLLSWLGKLQSKPQIQKEPTPLPLESLAEQDFKLFCSEHVKHFHEGGSYEEKTVHFWQPDAGLYDALKEGLKDPRYKTGMLFGDVFLDYYSQCSFEPFWPPSRASRTPVKVKSNDGKHELSFQFLGNGHIKLRVSRDFVFMGSGGARPKRYPPSAPREFEFVGIWFDRYKEFVDQQNAAVADRQNDVAE